MPLRADIRAAMTAAMKAGGDDLSTLRLAWSAIRNEEIAKQRELDDAQAVTVIGRQVKQLQDAVADFTRGGRADLIAATQREIIILRRYLPTALSRAEIEEIARRVMASPSFSETRDLGRIMGAVMKEVRGRADGAEVWAILAVILAA
ncbi:MAG: GatB/YqeY domain-containing protein [Candidatus Magasanikbacteria bacterium]|nr:GatB/YqeY domain-containing protein [Candidatus Magasanikbacteria bacterium]